MVQEDFDLASLAAYLHLTPEQVRKMVEREKIPGRRIGGVWKFSRPEIHQWFEERIGASDVKELAEVEKILQRQPIHQEVDVVPIPELLTVERIFVPFLAKTKNSVIDSICEMTSLAGVLWEPAKMADAIRTREELHPTALENGVALLHPRRPIPGILAEPFLSLAIQSSGIPFGGPRGSLTDVFFLIGSTNEAFHLRLLARISRLLQLPTFLLQLRACDHPTAVYQCLVEHDRLLD
jgi:nitrogen PTS system EIIA component